MKRKELDDLLARMDVVAAQDPSGIAPAIVNGVGQVSEERVLPERLKALFDSANKLLANRVRNGYDIAGIHEAQEMVRQGYLDAVDELSSGPGLIVGGLNRLCMEGESHMSGVFAQLVGSELEKIGQASAAITAHLNGLDTWGKLIQSWQLPVIRKYGVGTRFVESADNAMRAGKFSNNATATQAMNVAKKLLVSAKVVFSREHYAYSLDVFCDTTNAVMKRVALDGGFGEAGGVVQISESSLGEAGDHMLRNGWPAEREELFSRATLDYYSYADLYPEVFDANTRADPSARALVVRSLRSSYAFSSLTKTGNEARHVGQLAAKTLEQLGLRPERPFQKVGR